MNYKIYNDYELIYNVRENDDFSRDVLYEKYSPIIRKLASEYYKKFNQYGYEFDDFLQEAYISFQKAIVRFNDNKGCLFYTFVVMCIKRSLITFSKRISNKNLANTNMIDIDECIVVDHQSSVDNILSCNELETLLKNMMYSLSFDLGNILELRINNFSYCEIGKLLDIPLSTVNYRCRMVKKELDSLFLNYYSEKAN